jgi:hypothetical protein
VPPHARPREHRESAAEFIAELAKYLENPGLMML